LCEDVCERDQERRAFLQDQTGVREGTKQTQIRLLSGVEWMARKVVKEVVWEAVEVGTVLELARDWEEWRCDTKEMYSPQRSLYN
jgi:hypothetical protein